MLFVCPVQPLTSPLADTSASDDLKTALSEVCSKIGADIVLSTQLNSYSVHGRITLANNIRLISNCIPLID